MFSITASGTIAGQDPEVKAFQSGKTKTRFRLQNYRGKDKEGQHLKDYLTVEAWGQTGEFIANNFKQGDVIEVVGELENQVYEKEGQKKDFWVIRAHNAKRPPKAFEQKSDQGDFGF